MAKIAIDMDGTIADFTSLFIKEAGEKFDIQLTYNEVISYDISTFIFNRMTKEQQEEYKDNPRRIYKELLVDDFFNRIEPLEGAVDAVKEIYKQGHDIVFLTKVIDWDDTPKNKAKWLNKYFFEIEYDIIMVDSAKSKHIVDVDIIIDDDPRVLEGVTAIPICIAQPWNKSERNSYHAIADNMHDALGEISFILKTINTN